MSASNRQLFRAAGPSTNGHSSRPEGSSRGSSEEPTAAAASPESSAPANYSVASDDQSLDDPATQPTFGL